MDTRREVREIFKHFTRYERDMGETVIYYAFDAELSNYDRVYDEGYRRYRQGIRIPFLWVDQSEAPEDYAPEGRRPTQRLRIAVSALRLFEAGISVSEAHGNRLGDVSPSTVWRYDRNHDIMLYDSRYYEVASYNIRGRVKGEDVIIGLTGIETFPSDDMIFDFTPGSPAPAPGPEPPEPGTAYGYGEAPYGLGPYGGFS
jgi:hypothetical protein